MFDTALTVNDMIFLAKGAGMTIFVTVIAVFFGTILGIIFGVIRYQIGPIWAAPITFVLDIFRSIPLLIQLVLAYAFLGTVLRLGLSGLTVACIVLTLYTAAYCAEIVRGGPNEVLSALPREAGERTIYAIQTQGDGRGLARALCPSADEAWLVLGRVRAGRPLTMQAVGRWPDGQMRHCVGLSYTYRGEWALPPASGGPADTSRPGFTR